jgi:hypothetical protein
LLLTDRCGECIGQLAERLELLQCMLLFGLAQHGVVQKGGHRRGCMRGRGTAGRCEERLLVGVARRNAQGGKKKKKA